MSKTYNDKYDFENIAKDINHDAQDEINRELYE